MSLKTRLTSLVTAVANKAEALRLWTVTELDDVYSTIQGVVDAIPTTTSELTNDSGYITGLNNITEIPNRSYNNLQDLPTLNISNWNTAYGWGNHSTAGYLTTIPNFNKTTNGLVPMPGGATSTRYLREDGTWVVPTNTTYTSMTLAELNTGTATTARTISAKTLTDWLVAKNYITGINNITSIPNRSYTDLQNLPTLNLAQWNEAYAWGDHATENYVTGNNGITGLWKGTQTQYDALTPDPNVIYYII